MGNVVSLLPYATTSLSDRDVEQKVAHYTTASGSWDLLKLAQILPSEMCNKILAPPHPNSSKGMDKIS
ncbi:hypothetical protein Sjap_006210 [Stephania japonica]|uniref:Uncharacterized protein n=1 Tax=Stephania japonica TaxID=461633 RepID=A0AAP0K5H5_9MAGN